MGGIPVPPRSKSDLLLIANPLAKWVSACNLQECLRAKAPFSWGGGGGGEEGGDLKTCSLMGKGAVCSSLSGEATHSNLLPWWSCFQELCVGPREVGFSITSRWTTRTIAAVFQLCLLACLLALKGDGWCYSSTPIWCLPTLEVFSLDSGCVPFLLLTCPLPGLRLPAQTMVCASTLPDKGSRIT